jgi:hypothetical protein
MSAFHADLTLLGTMLFKQALRKIAQDIRGKPIDVVLYVDRLDLYRVGIRPLPHRMCTPHARHPATIQAAMRMSEKRRRAKAGR